MSRDMDSIGSSSRDPNSLSTKELHDKIWSILAFRDKVMKVVDTTCVAAFRSFSAGSAVSIVEQPILTHASCPFLVSRVEKIGLSSVVEKVSFTPSSGS